MAYCRSVNGLIVLSHSRVMGFRVKPLQTPFSVAFSVEDDTAIVCANASGLIDSSDYIDGYITFFGSLPEPWRYHYLSDLSRCTGFVAYSDLMRLADFWEPHLKHFPRRRKVAVVTKDRLMVERMPKMDDLLAQTSHRTFPTLKDARAWLLA